MQTVYCLAGRAVKRITNPPNLSITDIELLLLLISTLRHRCLSIAQIEAKKEEITNLLQLITADIQQKYFLVVDNSIKYIELVSNLYGDEQFINYYDKLGKNLSAWSISEETILASYASGDNTSTLSTYFRICSRLLDLNKLLYLCMDIVFNNYALENIFNILTVRADLTILSPLHFHRFQDYANPLELSNSGSFIDIIIDLGISNNLLRWIYENLQDKCRDTKRREAIKLSATSPLSLKQLARICIRKNMKDISVMRDCYKLPIPAVLQDYLSLWHINAKIRHFC